MKCDCGTAGKLGQVLVRLYRSSRNELLALADWAHIFAGVVFPRLNTTLWPFGTSGADRAINVITFKMDFRPSGFDRPATEDFKDRIASKLTRAGIATMTVIIKRGPCRELLLCFDGADEDVAKAKAAFDMT